MSTTFETAKVGDKIWSLFSGWGVITTMSPDNTYGLGVKYGIGKFDWYTMDGKYHPSDINQTLFWDEVKIVAPHKPLPDLPVDTKVYVWKDGGNKLPRHFCRFNKAGNAVCYLEGQTSWTTDGGTAYWKNWELVE